MSSFERALRLDARLRILQGLAERTDHRLSDLMLGHVLDAWGHRRSRDFVRTELRALAEIGAVRLVTDTEPLVVAELTTTGEDHVRRRIVLEGVKRPDPGE